MRVTNSKWGTSRCPSCGEAHSGYSGKLDGTNIEYVVCGVTNKRCNVSNSGQYTWVKENCDNWEMK